MTAFQNNMLNTIDEALETVLTQQTAHFQEAARYYADYRSTEYVAFEAMVNAELYARLQAKFSIVSVFMEFPGLAQERIDLHIRHTQKDQEDLIGYIETKMYYGRNKERYTKDFNNLKELVDLESNAMAIQIHFNLHQNRNRPNEEIMTSLAGLLPSNEYWTQLKQIGDSEVHFFRLAFAKK